MRKTRGASTARSVMLTAAFFVAIMSAILWGGVKPEQHLAEPASPPQAVQQPPTTTKTPEPGKVAKATPPKPGEVQSAILRVYEGTLTVDPNSYMVGDFDGDGSQDLVAVVSPITEMLPRLNSELARWKLEDPRKVTFPELKDLPRNPPPPAPVKAEEGERLLAVIHGSGPVGWRNPEAMNTYLLKNAVGSSMGPQPLKQALIAVRGNKGKDNLLSLRGDVIKQTLGKEKGFLFWTGADYAWHPLDNNRMIDRHSALSPHARS
jgi:hypothetical protein